MQSEVHELRGPLLSSFNASDDHRGNNAVQIMIGTLQHQLNRAYRPAEVA
jgi:hypothetical protein